MANLAIFELGLEAGAHVHLAHSSLARGFEVARLFRGMGGKATGEACIQYLCMTEEDVVRLEGFGKCNPPFRTAEEVERVWAALLRGEVAYVSTDHAPWPRERKVYAGDIFAPGAGLTGMQSFAPLMFTLLEERGLPPTLMARFCAERPARFHGLFPKKGAIRVGADADLCVLERGDVPLRRARHPRPGGCAVVALRRAGDAGAGGGDLAARAAGVGRARGAGDAGHGAVRAAAEPRHLPRRGVAASGGAGERVWRRSGRGRGGGFGRC